MHRSQASEYNTETAETFFQNLNQFDNVTKNIIREIIRECALNKVRISEELATYYVKLSALNPKWGLSPDRSISRSEVAIFVEECVKKLCEVHSPRIVCLKMQLAFHTHCTNREDIIESQTNRFLDQLIPVEKELLKVELTKGNEEEINQIYKQIVVYITLRAGLGNPLDQLVQLEAFTALQSIFSIEDVSYFVNVLHHEQKREHLAELANLVRGVRLYNRYVGKGGVGIEDVPKYLLNSSTEFMKVLKEKLNQVLQYAYSLTAAMEMVFDQDPDDIWFITHKMEQETLNPHANRHVSQLNFNRKIIKYAKGLLIITRQHELYLRRLIKELETIKENSMILIEELDVFFEKLDNTVKNKTAVPVRLVFPLFFKISDTWGALINETMVLQVMKAIYHELLSYTKNLNFDHPGIKKMIHDIDILSDHARVVKQYSYITEAVPDHCDLYDPMNIENIDELPIEFLGFCPLEFVEMKGVLIPGNSQNGVIFWNGNFFTCASPTKTRKFMMHPDIIVNRVVELARNQLELIFFLKIYDRLAEVKHLEQVYEKPIPVVSTSEFALQTDLHPVPSNIDKNYSWNTWEIKKEALLHTNLIRCKTKATRTNNSNYRAPVETQTCSPREKATMVDPDTSTNVPKLQTFIFGLRGRKDNQQHIVDLTRPVEE